MVDTLVLGASAARREGSSPFIRTKQKPQQKLGFLFDRVRRFEPEPKGREGENCQWQFAREPF